MCAWRTGVRIIMKMARASDKEVECLIEWLDKLEAACSTLWNEDNIAIIAQGIPEWRRVVFGHSTLVDNACDKTLDYLDWKPEIKEKMGINNEIN